MTNEIEQISTSDGKYTVVVDPCAQLSVLRYGEPWLGPGFPGCNMVIQLAQDLRTARNEIEQLKIQIGIEREEAKRAERILRSDIAYLEIDHGYAHKE
jgi:hypothetical protein